MLFFLRVFACILFSSYPCFFFFLWCLLGLPSAISCRNPYIEYGWTSYICHYNDCLKCGNSWGGPFCELQTAFFNVKSRQKLVKLGILFLSTNSDPKVIDILFVLHVSACILFFSYPCFLFFLRCLFWLPSVISCRNPYIEYGWTWYICQYNDCLKFGNSWRELQTAFFNLECSQQLINLGSPCLSTILIQKLLTYCFFSGCPLAFSSIPPLSFPFFSDVRLGCHQLSAAGTHTHIYIYTYT